MPEFGPIVTPEEIVSRHQAGVSRVDLSSYETYVNTIPDSHAGTIYLKDDDKRQVVKRRVTRVVRKLGREVRYLRSPSTELVFEVFRPVTQTTEHTPAARSPRTAKAVTSAEAVPA